MRLAMSGQQDPISVTTLLSDNAPRLTDWDQWFPYLAGLALLSLFTPLFLNTALALLLIGIMMCTNFWISYGVVQNRIEPYVDAIRCLAKVVGQAEELGGYLTRQAPETAALFPEARVTASKDVRKLKWGVPLVFAEAAYSGDLLEMAMGYLNAIFLVEARAYNRVVATVTRHREEILGLFTFVGEIDALLSVASFRDSLEQYCEPTFWPGAKPLRIREARHILVDDPVPNSIEIGNANPFVTGANMSGKTTFLKTIALNAVLAQSIYTCLAAEYAGGLYRIISSIDIRDDLKAHKSYYYAELERMHAIIESVSRGEPLLCTVDELLRGTNANERQAASRAILESLHAPNVVALISSHDTELVASLDGAYMGYHFDAEVSKSGLTFDYRLQTGHATTGNAIALMAQMGFPQALIDRAYAGLPRGEEDGTC